MKRFLVPSLLAAGFASNPAHAALDVQPHSSDHKSPKPLLQRFSLNHLFTLAGHYSHSSHSSHTSSYGGYSSGHYSHTSHSSHRSSYGGYSYTAPSTVPETTPTPAPATPLKTLPGNSKKFQDIAKRVQIALTALGYYHGPIDGKVGTGTRQALRQYQVDHGLLETGTITSQVLTDLNIAAR